ncbi:hypothetical protein [Lysinibacillus halotolerans]|uniref:Uncharacterized protein n=1 Tax=Lysinibacillus halotolerans TaxID=1368476 RepID=A0A3M8H8Q4_9BACI|nr:hypothetical protein [Lysinibacillus halotolerans]RNC98689.1 hypothetical protein EC501_09995 [Lysinibacillus halotolerans]
MSDLISVLHIPDDIGYWLVRADGGKYYEDFLLNNFIAVSDNEVTLESLINSGDSSIAGITIDHYKTLYKDIYKDWTAQQISHGTSRTFKFIQEMKIGDIVMVPSKKSTSFIIGIIKSNPYEISKEEIESKVEVNYAVNPFFKRRNIEWIKEVSRNEISEKLYWILSAHQTIFDLKEEKEYINQLLSPIYVQEGLCHGTLKISKEEGLNSNEWYDLYSIIKKQSNKSGHELIVRSNVQSPGLIELLSSDWVAVVTTVSILSGIVVGDVDFFGIKFKGIVPSIQAYKKGQMEIKKTEKEIEIMEEEKITKQLENERLRRELENEETKKEAELVRERLKITDFDAGKLISSVEKQMGNDDVRDAEQP